MKQREVPHPIFKWAGGKTSLIDTFEKNNLIPNNFKRYYEPFFGAGAMFFHLWNKNQIHKATISDINMDLFNVYNIVKNSCSDLISFSDEMDLKPSGETYYVNRYRFNELKKRNFQSLSKGERLERAVLMIYLNKTGYSGIYRENKNGVYNVPCGYYKNPKIIDEMNLYAVSDAFKEVTIKHVDYKKIIPSKPKSEDFVYLDPPYMPYSSVSNFRDYHQSGFDNSEQEKLCSAFVELTNKGIKALLSNSSNPELNLMYSKKRPDLTIMTIKAQRLINQKRIGKISVDEFVILNYSTNNINN